MATAVLNNKTTTTATATRAVASPEPTPKKVAKARATAEEMAAGYRDASAQLATLAEAFKLAAEPLTAKMNELKQALHKLAEGDLKPEFNGGKVIHLADASIGFKLGVKTVVMPESLTLAEEIKLAKKFLDTVRFNLPEAVTEVIDTKKLIGAWESNQVLVKGVKRLGIDVTQKDSFYVTPKKAGKKAD